MDHETESRLIKLEEELRTLRAELNALKGHGHQGARKEQSQVKQGRRRLENLLDIAKPSYLETRPIEKRETSLTEGTTSVTEKKQRSLEEIMMWALPKVFMIILVLGVL
ncbi:MAG: hypothetical protein RR595_11475 [Lysinibacillus sp.]